MAKRGGGGNDAIGVGIFVVLLIFFSNGGKIGDLTSPSGSATTSPAATASSSPQAGESPAATGSSTPNTPTGGSSPGSAESSDVQAAITKTKGTVKDWQAALTALETLQVKGKAAKTGYSRDFFGQAWADTAGDFYWTRDGLDTRNDALSRDLVGEKCKEGTVSKKTGHCKVLTGTLLYDPYSGATNYRFDSTDDKFDTDLDAEHIVALGSAYVTGAQSWPLAKREAFANDPLVLTMVNPSLNRQKGDADAATWLPPNKPYRAAYVTRQIHIKKAYGLWVTPAEKDAMKRVLTGALT